MVEPCRKIRGMRPVIYVGKYYFVNSSNLLVKRAFILLNAAFATAILDLISHVHLPSFDNKLP